MPFFVDFFRPKVTVITQQNNRDKRRIIALEQELSKYQKECTYLIQFLVNNDFRGEAQLAFRRLDPSKSYEEIKEHFDMLEAARTPKRKSFIKELLRVTQLCAELQGELKNLAHLVK